MVELHEQSVQRLQKTHPINPCLYVVHLIDVLEPGATKYTLTVLQAFDVFVAPSAAAGTAVTPRAYQLGPEILC